MSQENVEIVRRIYAQWEAGVFDGSESFFHPELEFEVRVGVDQVHTRGLEAMARYWGQQLSAWKHWRAGPIEGLRESGPCVVVFGRVYGIGRTSGIPLDMDACTVFTFKEGQIVRLALLTDRAQALAIAGLSE